MSHNYALLRRVAEADRNGGATAIRRIYDYRAAGVTLAALRKTLEAVKPQLAPRRFLRAAEARGLDSARPWSMAGGRYRGGVWRIAPPSPYRFDPLRQSRRYDERASARNTARKRVGLRGAPAPVGALTDDSLTWRSPALVVYSEQGRLVTAHHRESVTWMTSSSGRYKGGYPESRETYYELIEERLAPLAGPLPEGWTRGADGETMKRTVTFDGRLNGLRKVLKGQGIDSPLLPALDERANRNSVRAHVARRTAAALSR